ncbi:uncharacterized protein SEPMUDRAFT_150730 [Sphaerulina musiva SO2202]|uniref:Uncharacterized protein n=1 Tax=Sphaerulina musiva (strain SO2202) TaxID=692275 RepID=N1QG25_SPHMS|nr:uncharacterized protein SEPMUDRAFT_150730 [Sphaerulina musiva SO2202]EMF10717.1 hypothetical protein SEPMUDRAFT_150730 [Sphaerulina musiva SO2202]
MVVDQPHSPETELRRSIVSLPEGNSSTDIEADSLPQAKFFLNEQVLVVLCS